MLSKKISREYRRAKIRAKVRGTKKCPRLSVFRSLNATYVQLIDDETGKTLCAASDLKIKKGSRVEKAKSLGLEIAKLAKEVKITTICFDRSGYKYHGIVKALAESAREGGLKF